MDQLKKLLASLTLSQRVTILLVAVLVGGALVMLARWNRERDFRPLYTNLSAEDGGAVVQKLRETGIEFRLSENGTIVLVPSARVAELRLQMASAGLPKSGRIGFELFDKTNFGTTDFAEQVNYRRALEGELERSVMSLVEVEQARVHITFPKESIFLDARQPAKASVLLKLRPGAKLSPANVLAVTNLVGSAVEGLAPEAVSVLDMQGNLLNRPRRATPGDGSEASDGFLDYKQRLEKDLIAKINFALEPLLGPEKFRANASVECDFSSGEQNEENFDPSRSVMVSMQRAEDVTGTSTASGVPGTASNLPRPASRPGSVGAGVARRTENISYQSSRTTRHVRLPQGTVKRMSLAVLVDHSVRWEGTSPRAKRIVQPASPEKLKAVRELVAAASGFSAERGDQLIVENQPFESTLSWEPPTTTAQPPASPPGSSLPLPEWLDKALKQKNVGVLLAIGGGAMLLLVLLVTAVVRRSGAKARTAAKVDMRPALAAGAGAASGAQPAAIDGGRNVQHQMEGRLAEQSALKERLDAEALDSLKLSAVTTKKAEVLTKHINQEAKKDPVAMAQLMRTWLTDQDR